MQWYYAVSGQQQGPVDQETLAALARDGKLGRDDLVWNSTLGNQWAKASTVPGLFDAVPPGSAGEPPSLAAWSDQTQFRSEAPNRTLMAAARAALAGQWGLAVGGVLIYLVVQIAIGVLNFIPLLGTLVGFIVAGPLTFGWYRFFAALSRRQPAAVGMLFDGFSRFGTTFMAALLMGLLILAWMLPGMAVLVMMVAMGFKKAMGSGWPSMAVMVWVVPLLIAAWIPAIIAQFRYAMTYFIINDKPDIGAWEAIRHSTQMMKGNKMKLFCLQCRFIGWGLLCLFTFGIGFLWLGPYLMTSLGRFFDELVAEPGAGSEA